MNPAPTPKVSIRIIRADGDLETVAIMKGDQILCGRTGDLELHNDEFVAPRQLRLFFSTGRLAVEDIGGGNGVFLRLRTEQQLSARNELRIGHQRLVLEDIRPPNRSLDGAIPWGSADPGARYRLVQQLDGGFPGNSFLLFNGENHIGRERAPIAFPFDQFVSGKHAVIIVGPERISVRDLGSANGTFVKLNAPAFVENGDQLLVGRELLSVAIA